MKLAPGCSAVAWSVSVERVLPTLPSPSVISLPTGKAETHLLSAALQACRAEVSSGIHTDSEKIKAKGPGASCSSAGMQFPCQRQVPALEAEKRSTASG